MKLAYLDTFTMSERINVFHYCMFHGEASRQGSSFLLNAAHSLDDDFSDPICLSRNGTKIPDVFKPTTNLVVAFHVKEKLEQLPGIAFCPVAFAKLIDFPYQAGDFSYFSTVKYRLNPTKEDPETLIARLPNCPHLHHKAGKYYELVVDANWKIEQRYDHLSLVRFVKPYLCQSQIVELKLSRQMLADHPIFWVEGGILLTAMAFRLLSDHLDRDYFSVTEFEAIHI